MKSLGKRFQVMLVTAMVGAVCSAGVALVSTQPARAANTCSPALQKDEKFGPDDYRVRISCSALGPNTQARGQLVKNNGADEHSQWFSRLNTYYYTSWDECPFGCSAGSQTRTS